jgi:UDP-N-acetylglucosamine:LPS N-acetylglucosamine transferase
MSEAGTRKTLLAVSSGGGHWEQLQLLREGFAPFHVIYASTIAGIGRASGVESLQLPDVNRNQPLRALGAFWKALLLVRKVKPEVVVSTGAAPGLLVLLAGRLLGARTVWIDSVANAEQLSMSGKLARLFVDLHCTQWEHLADGTRTRFLGRVL